MTFRVVRSAIGVTALPTRRLFAVAREGLFQSGWFIKGLLSQILIVHMIRTRKVLFIQRTAALAVVLLTVVVMAAGIYVPFPRSERRPAWRNCYGHIVPGSPSYWSPIAP